MSGPLPGLVTIFVGPAIVAALITFALNTRDERRRALRDHITSVFDETRSDIRQAVSAGVAYFHCDDVEKLPDLEAQVLIYESDVRSAIAAIREACSDDELDAADLTALEGSFLDALTGGQFGSAHSIDPDRARQIIGLGTRLRSAVGQLRRRQLSSQQSRGLSGAGLFVLLAAFGLVVYGTGYITGLIAVQVKAPLQKNFPSQSHSA